MKKILLFFALITSGFPTVITAADTFDPATNTLTLDSVTIGGIKYPNVVVRLNQFTVLGVGNSAPVEDGISETCEAEDFTEDKFGAIQGGMSIEQVTQIIGCKSINQAWTDGLKYILWGGRYYYSGITVAFTTSSSTIPKVSVNEYAGNVLKQSDSLYRSFPLTNTTNNAFDPATNVLTMDSVWVTGGLKYENVAIHLDQFTVLGVAGETVVSPPPPVTPPPPPVNSGACGLDRFTATNFDAIQVGLSFDQVAQIMGCSPSRTDRLAGLVTQTWINLEVTQMFIAVTFDESSMSVTGNLGPAFKFWQGRFFVDQ